MLDFTCCNLGLSALLLLLFIGFFTIFYFITQHKYTTEVTKLENEKACKEAKFQTFKKNWTDYFWSNHMRFAWIMLFLVFFIALGASLCIYSTIIGLSIAITFSIITFFFLRFSYKSYNNFEAKATQQLKDFEAQIEKAVKGEISFDADNIQTLTSEDEAFDTEPLVFSFPTNVSKVQFPPYETRPPKQKIIATRKLEFLILSREYFSICKSAATFNLLDPKRAGPPKKCVELPGTAGECQEYYYSQIRNVRYDDKDESIHIIYYHDEDEDIKFPCKKIAPNRKPAMKALKGKLRLTERQRLHKIDEHEKYEKILDRRKNLDLDSTNNTKEEEDSEEKKD